MSLPEQALECPEEHLLLDFMAGTLSAPGTDRLHAHLDRCALCQRLVGELARAESLEASGEGACGEPPLMPGARLDRYFILGQVGVGGMGAVYAAFDPALDRKVALKLLHPASSLGDSPEARHRWLLAEAQALARLSHPNVVTVYEARVLGERLFLALELAEGGTLETWLRERRRSWREVLGVFLAAGEGLAAAHAAGLVHRDFKPANVLLRRDGRVQVTDFGLARQVEGPGGGGRAPSGTSVTTWRGACAGTPAYMAPEQREGGRVDARADQYSFCVALYEALHGERPPDAEAEEQPRLPRKRGVPGHLRRALQRGLDPTPEQRFASMPELLAALAREPLAAWRLPLLCTAALGLLVTGGVLGGAREEPSPCQAGARRWEGVWDAERQRVVREALEKNPSAGAATWKGVQGTLDTYTRAWVEHYTKACEATRVHGEQSEALLDARMHCLERRARDVQALTELLAREGARTDTSVSATWRLPSLETCAAPNAQAALQGLPAQGPLRERADVIAQRLSETRALSATGQYPLALEHALRTLDEAARLEHAPTRAEVLLEVGRLYMTLLQVEQAERTLLEAAWTAEAGRYDRVVADARISLLFVYGDMLARPTVNAPFVREAQAAVERLGGDSELEARFESTLGGVLMEQKQCAEALKHIERARVLTQRVSPPDASPGLDILVTLGRGHQCRGDLDAARAMFRQAIQQGEASLGPEHPAVFNLLLFEARVALEQGALADSLALFQRSLDLQLRGRAPNAEVLGVTHGMLSEVMLELGRLEEARYHALESLEHYARQGNMHPTRPASSWRLLGEVEARLGRVGEGLALLERALAAFEPLDAYQAANTRLELARWLFRSGRNVPRARQLAWEGHRVYVNTPYLLPAELKKAERVLAELGLSSAVRAAPAP
ncbi:tetratricopeptide repeat protein [Archangium minus]|uniref:Tetratricopeptide repeat protein n=1 Tax=Archangium minus TaxID=83450 RepID=A0ABY9X988_9BACT|nr:tetratricopeptide repeat protein [Archangium minus]